MPVGNDDKRMLDIQIDGETGHGKTTVLWILLQALETFGATVNVRGDDAYRLSHVETLRDLPHNIRPGQLRNMTVNVTTRTIERDEDDAEVTA